MSLDDTPSNAAACHHLSKRSGMDRETFQAVLVRIDADAWLQNHNIAVGVQELADERGRWRWENWLKLVQKKQQARQDDPYNPRMIARRQAAEREAQRRAAGGAQL